MPTEAGQAEVRSAVRRAMAGETNERLAQRAQVDPQTLGDFLAGRRWPRAATLAKIETALGLTPGMLAAIGEEPERPAALRPLSDATEEELLAELSYRITTLKRAASDPGQAEDEKSRDDGREGGRVTPIGHARWEMPERAAARRGQRARDQED